MSARDKFRLVSGALQFIGAMAAVIAVTLVLESPLEILTAIASSWFDLEPDEARDKMAVVGFGVIGVIALAARWGWLECKNSIRRAEERRAYPPQD